MIAAISGHMYPSGIEGMYISVRMSANRALALLGEFSKFGIFVLRNLQIKACSWP